MIVETGTCAVRVHGLQIHLKVLHQTTVLSKIDAEALRDALTVVVADLDRKMAVHYPAGRRR